MTDLDRLRAELRATNDPDARARYLAELERRGLCPPPDDCGAPDDAGCALYPRPNPEATGMDILTRAVAGIPRELPDDMCEAISPVSMAHRDRSWWGQRSRGHVRHIVTDGQLLPDNLEVMTQILSRLSGGWRWQRHEGGGAHARLLAWDGYGHMDVEQAYFPHTAEVSAIFSLEDGPHPDPAAVFAKHLRDLADAVERARDQDVL